MMYQSSPQPQHAATSRGSLTGFGAGGHARVVIALANRCGFQMRCLLDRQTAPQTQSTLDGVPIVYEDETSYYANLERELHHDHHGATLTHRQPEAAICVGTANSTAVRTSLYKRLSMLGFVFPTLIDPTTIREHAVAIGNGVHVLGGSILAAGAALGDNVLINHRVTVEHDCIIGDHVHLASGCVLCGGVQVGSGSLIGAGSVILPGIRIGKDCVVGAGSTVTRDIADGRTVVGNPARQLLHSQAA